MRYLIPLLFVLGCAPIPEQRSTTAISCYETENMCAAFCKQRNMSYQETVSHGMYEATCICSEPGFAGRWWSTYVDAYSVAHGFDYDIPRKHYVPKEDE